MYIYVVASFANNYVFTDELHLQVKQILSGMRLWIYDMCIFITGLYISKHFKNEQRSKDAAAKKNPNTYIFMFVS